MVEPDEVVEGKMEVVEPDDDLPVLAGAVAIPEPVEKPEPVPQVEGEIEVPMPMGDIVVPELDPETPPPEPDPDPLLGDTPCDGAQRPGDVMPSLPYEPAKPPPPPRGPRSDCPARRRERGLSSPAHAPEVVDSPCLGGDLADAGGAREHASHGAAAVVDGSRAPPRARLGAPGRPGSPLGRRRRSAASSWSASWARARWGRCSRPVTPSWIGSWRSRCCENPRPSRWPPGRCRPRSPRVGARTALRAGLVPIARDGTERARDDPPRGPRAGPAHPSQRRRRVRRGRGGRPGVHRDGARARRELAPASCGATRPPTGSRCCGCFSRPAPGWPRPTSPG